MKVARDAGCATVLRVDGPDELYLADLGDARVVGVTAGASAPDELVEAVIAVLAPEQGVELVRVTDEDEYFPPPPELRELVPALDALAAVVFGGDPGAAQALGGPFAGDRASDAADMLARLDDVATPGLQRSRGPRTPGRTATAARRASVAVSASTFSRATTPPVRVSGTIGSPTTITTPPNRGIGALWSRRISSLPAIPIGTIGAPDRSER